MTDLLALAARVEQLTGRDIALGHEILLACGWRKTCVGNFYGPLYHWSSPDGSKSYPEDRLPCPTESLDAAMTLVPEGCDFYFEVEQVMGGFCNYLYITGGGAVAPSHDLRGKGGKLHPTWKEAVAALPREISAASLRARSALEASRD